MARLWRSITSAFSPLTLDRKDWDTCDDDVPDFGATLDSIGVVEYVLVGAVSKGMCHGINITQIYLCHTELNKGSLWGHSQQHPKVIKAPDAVVLLLFFLLQCSTTRTTKESSASEGPCQGASRRGGLTHARTAVSIPPRPQREEGQFRGRRGGRPKIVGHGLHGSDAAYQLPDDAVASEPLVHI